jgi:hypothetical protein
MKYMENIVFKIHREPCVPNPCYRDAKKAKDKISSLGGRFYRFSINGCSATADLERHLIEAYGLSESAVNDALDMMAETTIPELTENLRELCGIAEIVDDAESTSFACYAFTKKELDVKTELFIAGVKKMKEHLQSTINKIDDEFLKKVSWEL